MDFNIARFDLVTMKLAVLCAESGSLSAASKRAHCSISAGSQRLSALESTLGRPLFILFIRDHRGLHLTDVGDLFVAHAKLILNQLEVFKAQLSAVVRETSEDTALA
jgi:DNA-binding transcriptional LysR family regulator